MRLSFCKTFLFLILAILFSSNINNSYASPLKEPLPGDIIVRDTNGELASEWEIAWRRIQGKSYRGGHTGIYAGDELVYDVMPQDEETGFLGGMRKVELNEFLKYSENYYIVTPKAYDVGDNYLKRFAVLSDLENFLESGLVTFDDTHACQKCVEYNPDDTIAKYIFDCGGLVEYVFEKNGIDVVPNNMEVFRIPGFYERRALTPHDYIVSPNVKVYGKYPSHPGGDNPDDFAGVLTSNSAFAVGNEANGNVGVLANGFFVEMMQLIGSGSLIQPNTVLDPKDYPVLIIPTGGLYGLENSEFFKANLEQYIKSGGMIVVLSQQHGYEFSVLPVPQETDGTFKTIIGYGWTEDQSCFSNAVYVDTYHQVLAGQTKATLDVSVDGYFTQYPSDSKILLRRTANGQPAMLLYQYGQGNVLITSLYEDWALKQNQSTRAGRNLIRDIITWTKTPSILSEVKPGETANATIIINNSTETDTASALLLLYDPSRSNLVETKTIAVTLPAGQKAEIPYSYTTTANSSLGIWHVDYLLYDNLGNVISSDVSFDSVRFVVSNPPANPYKSPDFNFSIQSDAEYYLYGSPATFTVIVWNNTNENHIITFKYELAHLGPNGSWVNGSQGINVPAKSSTSFNIIVPEVAYQGWLWGWFYDESGRLVGFAQKGIWMVYYPSLNITTTTDKTLYAKSETVTINASIKNNFSLGWQPEVKIAIYDSKNI